MPSYVSHHLIKPDRVESRVYQASILNTAINKNTLCVLPTGLGKTSIAILLAAQRLEKFPESKILIVAPTRPLCEQHFNAFANCLEFPKEKFILLTGKVSPADREAHYDYAQIISATPQTIENDLKNGTLNLKDFSLLIVDEVHRAVKNYAYPYVARKYAEQAEHPRILGLTASPGSNEERIKEICANLRAEAVEIRSEQDEDVVDYVQQTDIEVVKVNLTPGLEKAQRALKDALNARLDKLKEQKIHIHRKKDLLDAQRRMQAKLRGAINPMFFQQMITITEAVKVWHALELLETQSLNTVKVYFEKMGSSSAKSSKRLLNDPKIKMSVEAVRKMKEDGEEHPKMWELEKIVENELTKNPKAKIIVFSHYRENIQTIKKHLGALQSARPVVLIGQGGETGLSQKQQISIIRDYEDDAYNVLITSPIGEEGLHLASADIAIFYEPVASEIRTIQRRGRVGRTKLGKIIMLVTRNTRDEANFYTARRKESAMREILSDMQQELKQKKPTQLADFIG